jgi:hypothetical protein
MEGWIRLYRKVMDNEFYFSEKFTRSSAWIDLLLLANHKPATIFIRGIEVKVMEGQLCYSELTLGKRWKWNRKTVDRFLLMLKNRQMVDIKKSRVTTVISIANWNYYQKNEQQNGHQKDNKLDTNNNINNERRISSCSISGINYHNQNNIYELFKGEKKKEKIIEFGFKLIWNKPPLKSQIEKIDLLFKNKSIDDNELIITLKQSFYDILISDDIQHKKVVYLIAKIQGKIRDLFIKKELMKKREFEIEYDKKIKAIYEQIKID